MTIEQIEASLPNGLHDAEIRTCSMDYENARLALGVSVLVGLPVQPYPESERYRGGMLVFEGVLFYSVEFPRGDSSFRHPGAVGFSSERMPLEQIPASLASTVPPESQCCSLFVRDWLSHIYIAAAGVSFSWATAEPRPLAPEHGR